MQSSRSVVFSILTSVYVKTDARFFEETSNSVLGQDYDRFEWIVLAHGSISTDLSNKLDNLSGNSRVRMFRLPENVGIVGALRFCFVQARGDYAVPLDGDDLLTSDALRVLAHGIEQAARPGFIYSDEDLLREGTPSNPYFRSDFDPVFITENSYIWHLSAIRRDVAETLDLYTDPGAEWCHDWDTAMRVLRSGVQVLHIPEVLYHWRTHPASSTNRPDPESGSLRSQKNVMQQQLEATGRPSLYSIEQFPIFRGAFEWWIRRKPTEPAPIALIVFGERPRAVARTAAAVLRRSKFPFCQIILCTRDLDPGDHEWMLDLAHRCGGKDCLRVFDFDTPGALCTEITSSMAEFAVVCDAKISIADDQWPWECQKMFELHSEVSVVAARILDGQWRVAGGPEIFGYLGLVGCPDAGQPGNDPGYFALSLKQRCVSAPSSALFVARKHTLCAALHDALNWNGVGTWVGGHAAERGEKVAFTPIFTGMINETGGLRIGLDDGPRFARRFRKFIPDYRWYSINFGPNYSINDSAALLEVPSLCEKQ
jgi:hypothetical protein